MTRLVDTLLGAMLVGLMLLTLIFTLADAHSQLTLGGLIAGAVCVALAELIKRIK